MSLTNPYRQHHYMGEYADDSSALTFIQANKWDSAGNGTGNPQNGMLYYNTTSNQFKVYANGAWTALAQGTLDHGSLSGLGDDDHTQYILVAGTRAFSGNQSMGGFKLTNLAAATASGDAVRYDEFNDHTSASSSVHGVTGSVVGTSDEQTLSNKTLTTPTIADFTNATHDHQDNAGGGTLDHGLALTGLGDDDHTQYILVAGTRAFSGNQSMGGFKLTNLAAATASGDAVRYDEFNDHTSASSSVHGVTGSVVGTSDEQTLSNKTLTTPTIADFTNATHDHQDNAGGGTLDHGLALTGLSDDDHTQYALLAGRSGGQTLIGGTGASDGLLIQSTSNETKGLIKLDDQVVAGGTSAPTNAGDLTIADGILTIAEASAPTADADYGKIWTQSDNKLYFQDGAGTNHEVQLGGSITSAVTYYVDGDSGDDADDGLTPGTAKKTLAFLYSGDADALPREINAAVTVEVSGTVLAKTSSRHTTLDGFYGSGSITLNGATSDVITSQTVTGYDNTVTNDTYHSYVTVSGASWTVDEYKGKFIQFTASPSSTALYPILSNSATTLQTIGIPDISTSTVFKIVSVPLLKSATVADPNTLINISIFRLDNINLPSVTIKNLDFTGAQAINKSLNVFSTDSYVTFQNCSSLDFQVNISSNYVYFYRCYSYLSSSSGFSYAIDSKIVNFSGSVIGGNDTSAGFRASRNSNVRLDTTRISNQSVALDSNDFATFAIGNNCMFDSNVLALGTKCSEFIFGLGVGTNYIRFKDNTTALNLGGNRYRVFDNFNFIGTGNTVEVQVSDEVADTASFADINNEVKITNLSSGSYIQYLNATTKQPKTPAEYDNTSSGLSAINYQDAIDEVASDVSTYSDHGNLSGLSDDDHTQYILVAGTRAFSGNQSVGGFKLTNLAAATASGDAVRYDEFNDHTSASSSVHGVTGSVVGTSDEQTLSNKTLTTPTIADFTNATHDHQDNAGGGTLDHGLALTGLGDDDHTQYILVAGTRAFSGNQSMGSFKITNLADGSDANDAVNKGQLDSAISGLSWKNPAVVLKIKSDADQSETPPTAGSAGEAWVVNNWGGIYNDGDIIEWSGTAWVVIVANSGGEPPDGTRAVVIGASAAGSFAGYENDIATYSASGDSWSFEQVAENDALLINGDSSIYENSGYTYNGSAWVQFTGAGQINAGNGLTKDGNTLNVGEGSGITVSADAVAAKLESTGGLEIGSGSGIQIKINDTPDTLDVDLNGLKVVGVPSLFKINGTAVGASVTAANLDSVVDGSEVGSSRHIHNNIYYTETELGSTTGGSEGASLIGTDSKTNLGASTTVEGCLEDLNTKNPSKRSSGDGNPNGVVSGAVGDLYVDTTNDIPYVNVTGANTGWVVL